MRSRTIHLQATALVHEAYMRLVDQRSERKSRSHFLAVAAQTTRSIVVDNARAQRSGKQGAGAPMFPSMIP